MKPLFALIMAGLFVFSVRGNGIDSTKQSPLTPLLNDYYELKNALVKDDSGAAAAKAADFLKAVNGVDMKALSGKEHTTFMALQDKLSMDARHISEVKNLSHQREHFASLSLNMYTLAKASKLSDQAIYQDYCPMKKTYWLSNEAAIKNPYFGNEMLTCGQVKETLH